MDLQSTYNKIAEDWHRDHQQDTWWIEGTDKFISLLKPGASILDVGCGSGIKARYFIERGFKVTAIDFSENLLEIAKREAPAGEFLLMDIRDVKNIAATFAGVFAQASLLHLPKKEVPSILKDLKDELEPGGYLYLAVKEIRAGQPEEEIRIKDDYGYHYKVFFSYFTLPELKGYVTNLGMEICYENISSSETSKTEWIQLISRKP